MRNKYEIMNWPKGSLFSPRSLFSLLRFYKVIKFSDFVSIFSIYSSLGIVFWMISLSPLKAEISNVKSMIKNHVKHIGR